ncbi:phosphoribosylformylglycinamidine synthase subunit PurQ, partial [Escherichia coli]|uniref:phosphoribosylformylglycinamidine synthase subunit PurQ n=1 Tax=Escherichia coli TaxID=562 RepID=UPI00207BC1A9
ILFNDRVRDEFATFFHRPQTLALGVCNGCQMMSNLRELIPGSFCPPDTQRGAAFAEYSLPVGGNHKTVTGNRLPYIMDTIS